MITGEVTGQEKVYLALDGLADVLDFTRTKDEIGAELHGSTKARIDQSDYVPLSADYAKRKARQFPGQPILRATDRLYRSLTEAGAPGAILQAAQDTLTYGTAVPYGIYHQVGTANMPARPMVALTPENGRVIVAIQKRDAEQFTKDLGFEVR